MYDDLIKQLRETPSRSKRELLDKAADAIEELEQKFNSLLADTKQLADDMDECRICAHDATAVLCVAWHLDCRTCTSDCVCKDCDRGEKWEWRGRKKEG